VIRDVAGDHHPKPIGNLVISRKGERSVVGHGDRRGFPGGSRLTPTTQDLLARRDYECVRLDTQNRIGPEREGMAAVEGPS
jgi:hypothetical protein